MPLFLQHCEPGRWTTVEHNSWTESLERPNKGGGFQLGSRPVLLVFQKGAQGADDAALAVLIGLAEDGAQAVPRSVTVHVKLARVVWVREDGLRAEGLAKTAPRQIARLTPLKTLIDRGGLEQSHGHAGDARDELAIILAFTEETLDGLSFRGHRHVHDDLDLGRAGPDAVERDDVSEVLNGGSSETALHRVELEVGSAKGANVTGVLSRTRYKQSYRQFSQSRRSIACCPATCPPYAENSRDWKRSQGKEKHGAAAPIGGVSRLAPVSRRARRSVVAGSGSGPSLKRSFNASNRSCKSAKLAVVRQLFGEGRVGKKPPGTFYKRGWRLPRNSGDWPRAEACAAVADGVRVDAAAAKVVDSPGAR
ncbi:hypothetical protein Efla_003267 [Eimeria flavescens]